MSDIVERMLTDSENNYAEALAHLTGGALLGKPTFAGGAAATVQTLATLGIDTAESTSPTGAGSPAATCCRPACSPRSSAMSRGAPIPIWPPSRPGSPSPG